MLTTHDIERDGKKYILEWDVSKGTVSITEATTCEIEHEDDEQCDGCDMLEAYDYIENLT